MSRVRVIKFGGTSLATPSRLKRAARRVSRLVARGARVVVVVSARGHETDGLVRSAQLVAPDERRLVVAARERDRLLATGEERSASLFACALVSLGIAARSLRGGEAGLRADGPFGNARIVDVDPTPLVRLLANGVVPVVAGFQATRADGELVTLGRGGSDTSAVAIAASLGARCDIVTDVDGVFDRDPVVHASAERFTKLSHRDLVMLAERGARVVHADAARLAARYDVPLRVLHYAGSWKRDAGTRIRWSRAWTHDLVEAVA